MIGQRKDFSRNDVAKINRMYQCSEPLINHFFCEFTEENIGGFVNQPIDDKELAKEENVSESEYFSMVKPHKCLQISDYIFSELIGNNMTFDRVELLVISGKDNGALGK